MTILKRLEQVKSAASELRAAKTAIKNSALLGVADFLDQKRAQILTANVRDLKNLGKVTPAFRDRLLLDQKRIDLMIESLAAVARLDDPVGEKTEERVLANGLNIQRVRAPLGVILMIFESRPNVAIEAFSLAFKAGNAIILKGGRESMGTTAVIYQLIENALQDNQLSKACIWGIKNPDRKLTQFLLKQKDFIDIVVPRGGDGLISHVVKESLIPIIKNDRGLCHVYVDETAQLEMALNIAVNAKAQRPGVCNAIETVLVHENVAVNFIPELHMRLSAFQVEWHACPKTFSLLKKRSDVKRAKPKDWDTEYLDFKINCRIVRSFDEALNHIALHGSRHSEAIVTENRDRALRFQEAVDAAAVYWNASTRFTDGFELGLGGELGISTQKLHVRGPVGLRELTSTRWIITGTGQVRE